MNFSYDDYTNDPSRTSRPFLDSAFGESFLSIRDWQMSLIERFILISILDRIRPDLSIEIGTHKGGSLQVLSHFSKNVISIDINEYGSRKLSEDFKNVQFFVEDSAVLLPTLIPDLVRDAKPPEFILVDGSHSRHGVRADINSILEIEPKRDTVIICHDSFNPHCRMGMLDSTWASSPFVQYVEIDFIPGNLAHEDFDTSHRGEMWGGFAIALLSPTKRTGELVVSQSRRMVFEAALSVSKYRHEFSFLGRTITSASGLITRGVTYLQNFRPARFAKRLLKRGV